MRWNQAIVLGIVLSFVVGCDSDDPVPVDSGDPGGTAISQVQIEGCSKAAMADLLMLAQGINSLIADIENGNAGSGVTRDGTSLTWNIDQDFASPGATSPDQHVEGTITFSSDPTQGLMAGDTAKVDIAITSLGGPLAGTVDVLITVKSDTSVAVSGTVAVDNAASGCDATMTIPTSPEFVLTEKSTFGPRLAAEVFGIEFHGEIEITINVGDQSFSGTLKISAGSQEATIEIAGVEVGFDIFPDPETMQRLTGCLLGTSGDVVRLLGALAAVAAEAAPGGEDNPLVEIEGTSFTYDDDLTKVTGSLTLGLGTVGVTWQYQTSTGTTGSSTEPLVISLPPGLEGEATVHGAGSFQPPITGCTVTFTIEEATKLVLDLQGQGPVGGRVVIEAQVGDTVGRAVLVYDGPGEPSVTFEIDGIPVPAPVDGPVD